MKTGLAIIIGAGLSWTAISYILASIGAGLSSIIGMIGGL